MNAVVFRYTKVACRNVFDTTSMALRPLVAALALFLFAFYAHQSTDATVSFLVVSVAVCNIWSNAVISCAYEARQDIGDGRLEKVAMAPGGIIRYVVSQSVLQTLVATAQSALIIACFSWTITLPHFAFTLIGSLGVFLVFTAVSAAIGASLAIRGNSLLLSSLTVGVALSFSGAFYALSDVPTWVRLVSLTNPLSYGIDTLRSLWLSSSPVWSVPWQLVIVIGTSAMGALVPPMLVGHRFDPASTRQG